MRRPYGKQLVAAFVPVALCACTESLPPAPVAAQAQGTCPATEQPRLPSYCGQASWTAGVTELCNGTLTYRDYVYDDYGADEPVPAPFYGFANASSFTAGDQSYPVGAENTADLVKLELSLRGDEAEAVFELNTLYSADQTLAAIAIDIDHNLETGGGQWPGLNVASSGWEEVHLFRSGDPSTNTIRGTFPVPDAEQWTIWAAVGQADGTVMNVAFRGLAERTGSTTGSAWFEELQAAALAAGDITQFRTDVCASDLRRQVTRGAEGHETGFHERIYTSAYTLPPGEGVSITGIPGSKANGGQAFNFLGRYQPYAYYWPAKDGPLDVQLYLHGSAANHTHIVEQPGFQRDFGDGLGRLLVSPLGRGVNGAYSDISERDVLDALDDALSYFPVRPDRVVISGYSMGGYGAVRLAELYPHRFTGLVNLVGATGDTDANPRSSGGLIGNIVDFVRNLRNVPSTHWYGAADALVPLPEGLAMRDAMANDSAGVYDFFLHANADHSTPQGVDMWGKEAAISGTWVVPQISRITYRTDESLRYPEYSIKHDRAYWIRDIQARSEGFADVDVKSFGCGYPESRLETGFEPGVGPVHYVWERTYRHATGAILMPTQNRIEVTLSNVASMTIERAGACLHPGSVSYSVITDGPATILLDNGPSVQLPEAGQYAGSF